MLKFLTGFVTSIEYVLIALAVGLAGGFVTGWQVHGWKTDASVVHQQNATIAADATAVVTARTQGTALAKEQGKIGLDTDHARKELARTPILKKLAPVSVMVNLPAIPLDQPQPAPETSHATVCPAPTLDVLSVYGVGVLNHALDATYPDPAQWPADTRATASDAGLREVSDHLTLVAGIANKLRANYDSLMEAVEAFQNQQAHIRGAQ